MPYFEVEVFIDENDLKTEDLLNTLLNRVKLPFADFKFTSFIEDCRQAFEKKDDQKFKSLMRELEDAVYEASKLCVYYDR